MRTHFDEGFQLLSPGDFSAIRHLVGEDNVWRRWNQVVCPADSVKPVERRRGWSRERLERHNQERMGDLIATGWDLIVVDEAHRLGGSTDTVARYKLGRAHAQAAPYLLLLSATPHQGKTENVAQRKVTVEPLSASRSLAGMPGCRLARQAERAAAAGGH